MLIELAGEVTGFLDPIGIIRPGLLECSISVCVSFFCIIVFLLIYMYFMHDFHVIPPSNSVRLALSNVEMPLNFGFES